MGFPAKTIFILFSTIYITLTYSQCANNCNKNGKCNILGKCECFKGYTGSSCLLRTCPSAPQFADIAYANDLAHQNRECSGHGTCDRGTGICQCDNGYSGNACSKKACHNSCSGHGNCISLKTAASEYDGWTLNHSTTYNLWDADMMFGCQCEPGYFGYDCSQKICDYGADPRKSAVAFETVTMICDCTAGGSCESDLEFSLRLMGTTSGTWLNPTSTGREVARALMRIPGFYISNTSALTVDPITAVVNNVSPDLPICASGSTRTTEISFTRKAGDIPAISLYRSSLGGSIHFRVIIYVCV